MLEDSLHLPRGLSSNKMGPITCLTLMLMHPGVIRATVIEDSLHLLRGLLDGKVAVFTCLTLMLMRTELIDGSIRHCSMAFRLHAAA